MAATLSPFVYWGQSSGTISLKVDLRNVENLEVTLTEEGLDFSAQGLGVKGVNMYGFHLDFYLMVNPEKSRYRKTDIAVEFQIEKTANETWPRLTAERVKFPWLKIDFDKFPIDDSEDDGEDSEDNMKQSQEELLNRITKDMESEVTPEKPSLKQNYLFVYNLFQFVGYTYIFITLLYNYIRHGESAKQGAFEATGTQMIVCQAVSLLEIVHPILGLVRSNVLMSFAQVMGRNFVLFMLIMQEPRLQLSPLCWYIFLVWSAVEVVRYPFYMLQVVGFQPKFLTWLRYTIWIPLYPLGILIEATISFRSISYFAETGFFSAALPNCANIAFYFPYLLMVHLVLLCIGATNNLNYMRIQRQKQLYSGKSSSKFKAN